MKKKIFGLICARGGSKSIKNKNLKKIYKNKSLLQNSIEQGKKSKYINEVYVSSDSKIIINQAKKAGAIIPFVRPKILAKDNAYEIDVWKHFIKFLLKKGNCPDYVVSIPTTSPLRKIKDIDNIIKKITKNNYDIVFSLTKTNKNPYFNLVEIKKNNIQIVKKIKKIVKNRQEAPKIMAITTVAYAFKPEYIMSTKNIYSGKVGYIEIPQERSLDIDSKFDLEIAKNLIKHAKKSV